MMMRTPLSAPSLSPLWKAEYFLRFTEPAHRVKAERDERLRRDGGEVLRHKQSALQPLRQRLKPADKIHSGPNSREIEAVDGADIAIDDLADVKTHPDTNELLAHSVAVLIGRIDAAQQFLSGSEGGGGSARIRLPI